MNAEDINDAIPELAEYPIEITRAYAKLPDPPVRFFWRCTVCAVGKRGSVGSAATEEVALASGKAHVRFNHPVDG